MHLIATRPYADSEKLKANLETAGHQVSIAPLLVIKTNTKASIPDLPWQAILLTSANALSSLAKMGIDQELKQVRVMAVGPASADLATSLGFADVEQATGGDLGALIDLCRNSLRPDAGPLLYISGTVRSGDVVAELASHGFETKLVELYEAIPAERLPAKIVTAMRADDIDAVVLYSPRTARIWVELVKNAGLEKNITGIMHFCLSENVARHITTAFGDTCQIKLATNPNDDAMLDIIGKAGSSNGSRSPIPGESLDMANRKKPSVNRTRKNRPTVIEATATEVSSDTSNETVKDTASSSDKLDASAQTPSAKKSEADDSTGSNPSRSDTDTEQTGKPDQVKKPAQNGPTVQPRKSKTKLITGAVLASLLAGVVGGGYLYREHGAKLFGNTAAPAIDVGAIEGQAMEAIGTAQTASEAARSAGETAGAAIAEARSLADKVGALEEKLQGSASAVTSEQAEALQTRAAKLDADMSDVKQSIAGLKSALETAAAGAGSDADMSAVILKIDALSQQVEKISETDAMLAENGKRIDAIEAKLADLASAQAATAAQPNNSTPAIDTAKINAEVSALSSVIKSGQPFGEALSALEETLGAPLDLAALSANAASGVQTLDELQASLNNLSVAATETTTAPSDNAGLWSAFTSKLSSVVKVRKASDNDWTKRISQAQAALAAGSLQAAVAELDAGTNATTTPDNIAAWLLEARKHLEVSQALLILPQTVLGRLPAPAQ